MSDLQPAPAISLLIDEHYEFVYRYAYRLSGQQADAEDLTQQTFLAAQQHVDRLREPGAARGWLCTITRNSYLQSRRKVVEGLTVPELLETAVPAGPPEEITDEELQQALQTLPEEFRSPLILFYFREFSYKQIAACLDIPLGTVMSRIARAKGLLRQRLSPEVSTANSAAGMESSTALVKK